MWQRAVLAQVMHRGGPNASRFSQRAVTHEGLDAQARALTLRWADYTSMEEWSDAFGGHYLEEPPAPPDAGSQAKAVELLGRLTLATASTLTSLVGATEDTEEDAEDAAARAEAEAVRQRERAEQDDRDVFAAAEQALVVQHGQNH